MKVRMFYRIILLLICTAFVCVGCSLKLPQDTHTDANKIIVTDALGRQVKISSYAKRVVAVGPGALRLCCYFKDNDMIVGIEQMDKDGSMGKPYLMANPSLASLPVIGQGGPNNAPDPEKILAADPEVIFCTYISDAASVDKLQSKTGIPVVALSYGNTAVFDSEVYNSLKIIGKIVGKEQEAQKTIDYMENLRKDLMARTQDIPEDKKPRVYVGALGMKGSHGIESTYGNYSLFNAINAKNVADEIGKDGSMMIDQEKLIQWNPDKLFIDAGGLSIVQENYRKSPEYYQILSAVKNEEVYLQLPFNYYHTNIDTAMANAYYMGKVIYPEQFSDIDPEKKADEVYMFLLGKELYSQMKRDFGGFRKLTFGKE